MIAKNGYWLLHEGVKTLAEIERNGIRIDTKKLDSNIAECESISKKLVTDLKESKTYRKWVQRFGRKTNLESNDQLGEVLFGIEKVATGRKTATGKWTVDDQTLQSIETPFVKTYLQYRKYNKVKGTFLLGIKREVISGYLHPFFHLHIARSLRSSSSEPNFQNLPVRDLESSRLIRECFIPREDRVLVEADYSGIEVRVAACYHKDPTMLDYIHDPSKDMHRDMASEIFKLPPKDVSKMMRYCAKNMFVFPQFYGDFYISCASSMWEAIQKYNLEHAGQSLYLHLKSKGIAKLGNLDPKEDPGKNSFVGHMKSIENSFWNERFSVYSSWKKRWHSKYIDNGFFDTLSGFRVHGHFNRKEVINYPVQGSAFHCLLWSLIHLQKEINKRRMKTLLVGQIHDSIVADVPKDEVKTYLDLLQEIMITRLRKNWKWIITPLDIEVEGSDVNWFLKKEMPL